MRVLSKSTKSFHGPLNKNCFIGWADAFPAPLFYEHRQGKRMNETAITLETHIWPMTIHLGLKAPAASEGEGWDWEGWLLSPHSQKSPGLCGEGLAHNRSSLHGQHRDGGWRWSWDGCSEGADLTRTCGGREIESQNVHTQTLTVISPSFQLASYILLLP